MGAFEIGVVLPTAQFGPDRATPRWPWIRDIALRCEAMGFDTLWTVDELLFRPEDRPVMGIWEGIGIAGAIAATTTRAGVGTWVMSALHRNAGITAKAAETLDEISGGRFIFGLGAGHAWPGQAHSFGLPEDRIFDRFDEALRIIVPLLREGRADFEGTWHQARDLPQQPRGPRPGAIPIMIGGNGPRGQRNAATYADIWSGWPEEGSALEAYAPKLASLDAICEALGRDPATIGRSAGVTIDALAPKGEGRNGAITGEPEEIADVVRSFWEAGFTRVEILLETETTETYEGLAPVVELLKAG